ncbi:hypothetical protein CV014_21400 [Nostoc sp. CMAA1605]|nr:hypothetical protein [Nostoc sp. CMAA1605]
MLSAEWGVLSGSWECWLLSGELNSPLSTLSTQSPIPSPQSPVPNPQPRPYFKTFDQKRLLP